MQWVMDEEAGKERQKKKQKLIEDIKWACTQEKSSDLIKSIYIHFGYLWYHDTPLRIHETCKRIGKE